MILFRGFLGLGLAVDSAYQACRDRTEGCNREDKVLTLSLPNIPSTTTESG